MSDQEEISRAVSGAASIIASMHRMEHYKSLSTLVGPGEQVPMFVGPCFYCGHGWIPAFPHFCTNCNRKLTGIIHIPEFWYASERRFRVYWRWQLFKYELKNVFPFNMLSVILDLQK